MKRTPEVCELTMNLLRRLSGLPKGYWPLVSAMLEAAPIEQQIARRNLHREDPAVAGGEFVPLSKLISKKMKISGISKELFEHSLAQLQGQVGMYQAEGADYAEPFVKAFALDLSTEEVCERLVLARKTPQSLFEATYHRELIPAKEDLQEVASC